MPFEACIDMTEHDPIKLTFYVIIMTTLRVAWYFDRNNIYSCPYSGHTPMITNQSFFVTHNLSLV